MRDPAEPLRMLNPSPAAPDESLVAWLWERRAFAEPWLTLMDGSRTRVVFSGRRWGGPGPDFRGAVLERNDGTLVRGDVEVHWRAGDWIRHGHQRDSAYRQVVLHVVLQPSGSAVRRDDGVSVPTVALGTQLGAPLELLRLRYARERDQPTHPIACVRDEAEAAALLDAAGQERFQVRAARLEADLTAISPEQLMYRELMVTMGYSANKQACRQLAETIPYLELVAALGERSPDRRVATAQALLIGRAGLLPTSELPVPGELLREWALLDVPGSARLDCRAWRLQSSRPDNSPLRRLAGLGAWLASRVQGDWVSDLSDAVRRASARTSSGGLADLFRVRAEDDFWPRHFGLGRDLREPRPWLIGRGRAMEMVVNVLLPACFALGQANGDDTLSAAARRCYERFPASPGNQVVRYMATQVAGGAAQRVKLNALRQQGLLHLFSVWCAGRWCASCPAGGGRPLEVPIPL